MKTIVAALILLMAQVENSYAQCFFCSSEKKSFLAACLKSEPAATYDICACVWEANPSSTMLMKERSLPRILQVTSRLRRATSRKTELRGPKNSKRRPRPLAQRLRRRVVPSAKWWHHRSRHCGNIRFSFVY